MYDEFNKKDGENNIKNDRPVGGIYSGQRYDYNNSGQVSFTTGNIPTEQNGTNGQASDTDVYVRMSKRRAEMENTAEAVKETAAEAADSSENSVVGGNPAAPQIVTNQVETELSKSEERAITVSPSEEEIKEYAAVRDRRADAISPREEEIKEYAAVRDRRADAIYSRVNEGRSVYSSGRIHDMQADRPQAPVNMGNVPPSGMNGTSDNGKKKKDKKANPFWKKLIATVALGIVFGLTAGATIYFMDAYNGKLALPVKNEAEADADSENQNDIIKEVQTTKPDEEADAKKKDEGNTANQNGDATITETSAGVMAMDVTEVVENVMPSVVSITGNFTVKSRDFWGQVYEQQSSGSGSGIIIGQNEQYLLIATNNHVVEDADELSVQFIDGTTADARIKGTDSDIDLAVILVDISDITSATKNAISVAVLGDSDSIKVGETAIAIGNALGYGQSVTTGVISAVDRTLELSDGTVAKGLIQTDAAINPGNSGGALLNAYGEVIGINSSKIGGTTVDGVGFAIPISSAEPILSDIVTSEDRVKVSDGKAGYLGIGGVTVTEEASQMYGIPVGVVVRQVYEGTGADKAGIRQGDVIVSIEGRSVDSMESLREELTYYEYGEVVEIEVYRNVDGTYSPETVEIELVKESDLRG